MKQILFLSLLLCTTIVQGQSFQHYNDTVNHFSINVPAEWKYGVPKNQPNIEFVAYRIPSGPTDTVKHNFNLNILETPKMNLDITYEAFLKSISKASEFKMIDKGRALINGKQFKWIIESHRNANNQILMHNYVFLTYQNDKTYILTMVTFSREFDAMKETYTQIANSFKLTE